MSTSSSSTSPRHSPKRRNRRYRGRSRSRSRSRSPVDSRSPPRNTRLRSRSYSRSYSRSRSRSPRRENERHERHERHTYRHDHRDRDRERQSQSHQRRQHREYEHKDKHKDKHTHHRNRIDHQENHHKHTSSTAAQRDRKHRGDLKHITRKDDKTQLDRHSSRSVHAAHAANATHAANSSRTATKSTHPARSKHSAHSSHPSRPSRASRPVRSSHAARPKILPANAAPISYHQDFERLRPLFTLYLDVQKGLDLRGLRDDKEVKGRWKRFVERWNHGELAEGWYLQRTKERAEDVFGLEEEGGDEAGSTGQDGQHLAANIGPIDDDDDENDSEDSEDSDIGPAPASALSSRNLTSQRNQYKTSGPTIPKIDDLTLRNELIATEQSQAQHASRTAQRQAYTSERRLRTNDLESSGLAAPRPDAGSHERRLEKRRETSGVMRAFRDAKDGLDDVEVGDAELMGGGGDGEGVGGLKARKKDMERKKNEREIQREEILRARRAATEERMAKVRAKEEKTVGMLRELARARFG